MICTSVENSVQELTDYTTQSNTERKERRTERLKERKEGRKPRTKFEKFCQKKFQYPIWYLTRNCHFKENLS